MGKEFTFVGITEYLAMTDQLILLQLKEMPDNLKQQVVDFIGYLLSKHSTKKSEKNKPTFGSGKGKYKMAADFDAPLEDFKDYME